jgi:hypothetical protein
VAERGGIYRDPGVEPDDGPRAAPSGRWLARVVLVVGVVFLAAVASTALRAPAPGCPADLPRRLADEPEGLSLCMPAHWREVKADDEAVWREIYGDELSNAERWIKDGTMQHFAVPFAPPDDDGLVHLAIYISDLSPLMTLENAQTTYAGQIDGEGETILDTDVVEFETATAALIVSERARTSEGQAVVDHFLNWIFVEDGRGYYVLLASSDTQAGEYRELFLAMAGTVRVGSAASPTPSISPPPS